MSTFILQFIRNTQNQLFFLNKIFTEQKWNHLKSNRRLKLSDKYNQDAICLKNRAGDIFETF